MRAVSNRRDRWRAAVLRHRAPRMTGEVRALLLVLADSGRMDKNAEVSIPRKELAEMFDVTPARITERVQRAHELGLLVTLQKGYPGHTAVYQGAIPSSVETGGWRGVRQTGPVGVRRTGPVTTGPSPRTPEEADKGPSRRVARGSSDFPSPDKVTVAAATGPEKQSHLSEGNIRVRSRSSENEQTATKKRRPSPHITIHNEGPEAERNRQLRELERLMERVVDATSPAAHGLQETA